MKFIAPEFAKLNTLRQLASKLGISTKGSKQVLREAVIKAYRKATSPEAVTQYARLSARVWIGSKAAYSKINQVATVAWTNIKHYAPMVLLGTILALLQFLYCIAVVWSWLVDTAEEVDSYYQQQINSRVLGLDVEEPQPAEAVLAEKVKEIATTVVNAVKPVVKEVIESTKPQVVQSINQVKELATELNRNRYSQERLTAAVVLGFLIEITWGNLI